MLNCGELQGYVGGFSLVKDCDVINDGAIRIALPLTYPNGSHIDLFLKSNDDLFETFTLSDYGLTYDYLEEMKFDPNATKKRRKMVDDICRLLNVKQHAGVFQITLTRDELKDLPSAMIRLAQACIRIVDLYFTKKVLSFASFESEVEEYIASTELPYEEDVELLGKYNKVVKVDFSVRGKTVHSLVQTLSTRNPAMAHRAFTDAFAKWWDLQPHKRNFQFVTVYDSQSSSLREEDLRRMEDWSELFSFPEEQKELREALAS